MRRAALGVAAGDGPGRLLDVRGRVAHGHPQPGGGQQGRVVAAVPYCHHVLQGQPQTPGQEGHGGQLAGPGGSQLDRAVAAVHGQGRALHLRKEGVAGRARHQQRVDLEDVPAGQAGGRALQRAAAAGQHPFVERGDIRRALQHPAAGRGHMVPAVPVDVLDREAAPPGRLLHPGQAVGAKGPPPEARAGAGVDHLRSVVQHQPLHPGRHRVQGGGQAPRRAPGGRRHDAAPLRRGGGRFGQARRKGVGVAAQGGAVQVQSQQFIAHRRTPLPGAAPCRTGCPAGCSPSAAGTGGPPGR